MFGKEIRPGYKVVTLSLKSVSIYTRGQVQYKVGKFVRPQRGCGPLCVFSNFREARHFADHQLGRLFRCLYKVSDKHCTWTSSQDITLIDFLPNKTVLATSVKLLEEVPEEL